MVEERSTGRKFCTGTVLEPVASGINCTFYPLFESPPSPKLMTFMSFHFTTLNVTMTQSKGING